MAIKYQHHATGRVITALEPTDEPVRRQRQRAARIAALDKSREWHRVDPEGQERAPDVPDHVGAEWSGAVFFDPSGYTVPAVNAYLSGVDGHERGRVIQAECEGKARAGIIRGPYADLTGA